MDGANDDEVVSFGDAAEVVYYFPGGGGVQTRGRFVEEENLWAGDELAGDADTALLSA